MAEVPAIEDYEVATSLEPPADPPGSQQAVAWNTTYRGSLRAIFEYEKSHPGARYKIVGERNPRGKTRD